jgi:hypothetical protein
MWKLLFASVRGTAHERLGQPCQDHCLARLRPTPCGPVLVLACADGAGTAPHAEVGARLACHGIARHAFRDFAEGLEVAAVDRDTVLSWHVRLRNDLEEQGQRLDVALSQLACTLLLAVVGTDGAVFSQVGDGALVTGGPGGYAPVFWPQSGEYANTTNFVTDEAFAEHLAFEARPGRLDELALLTDGLQLLALTFADRSAHQPFFRPLFRRLRAASGREGLSRSLRDFLSSPAVNARSDDDKTLVLATRVPGEPEAEVR